MLSSFIFVKLFLLFGLAFWLLIAARNNFIDKQTNHSLIQKMFNMSLLRDCDSNLGSGLLHRSFHKNVANKILNMIIIFQIIISMLLFFSAFLIFSKVINYPIFSDCNVLNFINFGLLLFELLWMFFLCVGLWFGYWIKMGSIQQVHFTLLIVGMLMIILMNIK